MDPQSLIAALGACQSPDPAVRKAGEDALNQVPECHAWSPGRQGPHAPPSAWQLGLAAATRFPLPAAIPSRAPPVLRSAQLWHQLL